MTIDWDQMIRAEDKAAAQKTENALQAQAQARRYLAQTDWYIIRAADTGTPVPEPVRLARLAARDLLSSDNST